MNIFDYFDQFDRVQPMIIDCKKCKQDYMAAKGSHAGQEIPLPKYCMYCGHELVTVGHADAEKGELH